jgi:5-methylcytosine-specific restriction endonuclease McrA
MAQDQQWFWAIAVFTRFLGRCWGMICQECKKEFKATARGRPPKYCSAKCREHARPDTERRREQRRSSYRRFYQRNREKVLEKNAQWAKGHRSKSAEYVRTYRERHPDKVQKYVRSYLVQNRDAVLERKRAYHKDHSEKDREYRISHRAKGNKSARESRARYCAQHPEEVRQKNREFYRRNPAKYLAKEQRRRTKKSNAGGAYTAEEWNALLDLYGHCCLWCGRSDVKLTVDHIVPVSLGGTSNIDNIQPLCRSCNSRKRTKVMDFRGKVHAA